MAGIKGGRGAGGTSAGGMQEGAGGARAALPLRGIER